MSLVGYASCCLQLPDHLMQLVSLLKALHHPFERCRMLLEQPVPMHYSPPQECLSILARQGPLTEEYKSLEHGEVSKPFDRIAVLHSLSHQPCHLDRRLLVQLRLAQPCRHVSVHRDGALQLLHVPLALPPRVHGNFTKPGMWTSNGCNRNAMHVGRKQPTSLATSPPVAARPVWGHVDFDPLEETVDLTCEDDEDQVDEAGESSQRLCDASCQRCLGVVGHDEEQEADDAEVPNPHVPEPREETRPEPELLLKVRDVSLCLDTLVGRVVEHDAGAVPQFDSAVETEVVKVLGGLRSSSFELHLLQSLQDRCSLLHRSLPQQHLHPLGVAVV
mmetsp:Transcript_10297/g.34377  ORF Transcript_10297/g.34377 Transcript_10297/m.34377 type:complete len:332 (+) Transcript_10297:1003-1998(+)